MKQKFLHFLPLTFSFNNVSLSCHFQGVLSIAQEFQGRQTKRPVLQLFFDEAKYYFANGTEQTPEGIQLTTMLHPQLLYQSTMSKYCNWATSKDDTMRLRKVQE